MSELLFIINTVLNTLQLAVLAFIVCFVYLKQSLVTDANRELMLLNAGIDKLNRNFESLCSRIANEQGKNR